jgi:RNA polymerase sigma factor (sigma-70 family)
MELTTSETSQIDFTRAFADYNDSLLKYVRHHAYFYDAATIEDIVQTTWVQAWESRAQYQGRHGASLKTWLTTIARNELGQVARRNKVRHVEDTCSLPDHEHHAGSIDPSTVRLRMPQPFVSLYVADLLRECSPTQQQIVDAYHIRGLELSEISCMLGKSRSAIKAELHRAHERMRLGRMGYSQMQTAYLSRWKSGVRTGSGRGIRKPKLPPSPSPAAANLGLTLSHSA